MHRVLSHKHLKEPNQSNLSGRRAMPWIQVFGAQDSTLKGCAPFPFAKALMHVLHTMFSQLLDDLLPLLTLLILKHVIRWKWFFFNFKLMEQADFIFIWAMWSAKVFLFQFFDGATQSGNLTKNFTKSLCESESHWILFWHQSDKILTKKQCWQSVVKKEKSKGGYIYTIFQSPISDTVVGRHPHLNSTTLCTINVGNKMYF
jgi:hypothetical protein